jgi:hypothetical protein
MTYKLWGAIHDDAEHTVSKHLRAVYSAYCLVDVYRSREDYIEFSDPKMYTMFILKYAEYL